MDAGWKAEGWNVTHAELLGLGLVPGMITGLEDVMCSWSNGLMWSAALPMAKTWFNQLLE